MPDNSFKSYYLRLWQEHVSQATPWARDNIAWGVVVLILPPLLAFFVLKRTVDWPLLWTTLLFYGAALFVYGAAHFVRAAWKCDLARQEEIRQRDGRIANNEDVFNEVLGQYKAVLTTLDLGALRLAKDLRELSAELGSKPVPPLIAGEDTLASIRRITSAVLPWQDKVTYGYESKLAERVRLLRNQFAEVGQVDFSLDALAPRIVDTDQAEELANRFVVLALREVAARQLRGATLKQLCCN